MGVQCGGYGKSPKKLRYKDQNHRFVSTSSQPWDRRKVSGLGFEGRPAHELVQEARITPADAVHSSLAQTAHRDAAVGFFLRECVTIGRGLESTRGLFEAIVPILGTEPADSPLATAVLVAAWSHLSLWAGGPAAFLSPRPELGQCLARLGAAIQDPVERGKPHTMLAALLLHWRENVASVYAAQRVLRHHLHGAISLLPVQDPPGEPGSVGLVSTYLARFLLHVQVSMALRDGQPLSDQALSQMRASCGLAPPNPSSMLDDIGLDIVRLQVDHAALLEKSSFLQSSPSYPSHPPDSLDWLRQATCIYRRLLDWVQTLPKHWHPLRLASSRDFPSSCISYQETCHVYTCCQVASIWNLWRYYRLRCVQMLLVLVDRQEVCLGESSVGRDGTGFWADLVPATLQEDLQAIVDDMCYAVPFYLGNRTRPSSLCDFSDPAIAFPSQHSLARSDARLRDWDRYLEQDAVSENDHKHHAIAQGAWHLLGPLSRLLNMLASPDGCLIARLLRPAQLDWIREQFLRVAILLRLPSHPSSHARKAFSRADRMAQQLHNTYSIIGGM